MPVAHAEFLVDLLASFTKYLTSHCAAAFSYTPPVTVSLSADHHAFPFIEGKHGLDDGGVKATGTPVATAAALTGKYGPDFFSAGRERPSVGV